jgi:hypothetical protein
MHNCQFSKHKSISIIDNNVLLHYLTAYAFSRVCLVFCFIQETCIVYIGCLWRALFLNINGVKLHAQLKCLVFSLNYILGSCLDRSHGERTRDISRVLAEIKLDQVRDNRKSPSVRRTRRPSHSSLLLRPLGVSCSLGLCLDLSPLSLIRGVCWSLLQPPPVVLGRE